MPRACNKKLVLAGPHHVETELAEHLDAERIDLGHHDASAAVAADHRDEGADGAAAEDDDGVTRLHLGAPHVVSGDRERLDHRGLVVAERGGHVEHAPGLHRPVVLHPARQLHAVDLEAIAEVVAAHPAGAALAAGVDGLDHHAIPRPEAAARRRLHHLREGLVPDDAALGDAVIEMALEDVQVGAADAGASHSEERLVGGARRARDGAGAERAGAFVEGSPHARISFSRPDARDLPRGGAPTI